MNIRKLSPQDEQQMLNLMDEFWMKHHRGELLSGEIKEIAALKYPQAQMKIELNQYFNWHTYVLEETDELLGFVCGEITIEEDRILDKIGYIQELFVTEKARGRKFGKLLMNKILKVLEDEGCTVFKTSAYINNIAALTLYRSLGFIDEAIELSRKVKR